MNPTISCAELERMLRAVDGPREAVVTTRTAPSMRKTGNPYVGRATHWAVRKCWLNRSYAGMVNDERESRGLARDFVPQARPWGTRIDGTPLLEHKGALYLDVLQEWSVGHFEVDGGAVDDETLRPYLYDPHHKDELPMQPRALKLSSIREITIDGTHYVVAG